MQPPIPVYPLSKAEGIPLPDSDFAIELPQTRGHLFATAVEYSGEFDSQEFVVVGIVDSPPEIVGDIRHSSTPVVDLHKVLSPIGLICRVLDRELIDEQSGTLMISLRALGRIEMTSLTWFTGMSAPILTVTSDPIHEEISPDEEQALENLMDMINMYRARYTAFDSHMSYQPAGTSNLIRTINWAASYILKLPDERLRYLQSRDNNERAAIVLKAILPLLREQRPKRKPRPKKEEVVVATPQTLPEKVAALNVPPESKQKLNREVEKLGQVQPGSAEHAALVDYLTWVTDLPWGVQTREPIHLPGLMDQLAETHYGLDEVKSHILEYMCIEEITGSTNGTVVCFVGPPGTGKTSIAKTIAGAANRKLVKVALGGLSDEAELRGHRRTYVAARPGRLVTGIKSAGTMDPLFLFDEIDKMAQYGRGGDPTAAMLEILDPEQNNQFVDRYLELPMDISKAMFICTANEERDIPVPLLDRMELVRFREYTREERLHIIREHLLPRARTEYKMEDFPIVWADETIEALADKVQIRLIDKLIRKLLRMAAVEIQVRQKDGVVINLTFTKDVLLPAQKQVRVGF